MLSLHIVSGDRAHQIEAPDESTVGRGLDCEVRLRGWDVSQQHARFFRTPVGISVEDLGGWGGVSVNGTLVQCYGPLGHNDVVKVGSHQLRLVDLNDRTTSASEARVTCQVANLRVVTTEGRSTNTDSFGSAETFTEEALPAEISNCIEAHAAMPGSTPLDVLGPLRPLLSDRSVTKVLLNRHDEIFVERNGSLQAHPTGFADEVAAAEAIQQLLAPANLGFGGAEPIVDAKLPDGMRVTAIMPPAARAGLTVLIRKSVKHELSIEDLIRLDAMTPAMADFLRNAVEKEQNILVSGTATSGKSALLRGLCNWIPAEQRILTIEDVAEFQLSSPHLVSLEFGRNETAMEGSTSSDALMQAALRLRPDRVILDECRGKEALPVLQAMTFRSCAWMASVPAKSPLHALKSLQTLAMTADVAVSSHAAQELVASAVDVLVHQERFSCGSRKVSSVAEIRRIEDGTLRVKERFRFEHVGYEPDGKVYGEFVECSH